MEKISLKVMGYKNYVTVYIYLYQKFTLSYLRLENIV